MSVHKRGEKWIVRVQSGGKRVQKSLSAGSSGKATALALEASLRIKLREDSNWSERIPWPTAVIRKYKPGTKVAHDLRFLSRLDNLCLHQITDAMLRDLQRERKSGGLSNASVNRTMAIVRGLLRDNGFSPRIPMLREPSRRVRWISETDAERLISYLPHHTAQMVRFSLHTGLRESNVVGLTWDHVDLNRRTAWVEAHQTKNRRSYSVPLNNKAMVVLRQEQGHNRVWCFTYKGERIRKAGSTAWHRGLKQAGIEGFRWHDLRHTWASWLVQRGIPLAHLQQLGGWESLEMVQKYAHLGESHLAEWVNKLSEPKVVDDETSQMRVLFPQNIKRR